MFSRSWFSAEVFAHQGGCEVAGDVHQLKRHVAVVLTLMHTQSIQALLKSVAAQPARADLELTLNLWGAGAQVPAASETRPARQMHTLDWGLAKRKMRFFSQMKTVYRPESFGKSEELAPETRGYKGEALGKLMSKLKIVYVLFPPFFRVEFILGTGLPHSPGKGSCRSP